MKFCIHDVKTVTELYDEKQVNNCIRDGWVLLSVGLATRDINDHVKTYILGHVDEDALKPSPENLFNRFSK